jgi:hypothetical protein
MSFKGLNNKLALQLIDWGLPPSIIDAFLDELKRTFSKMDPSEVPTSRRLGMNTNVIVPDPNDPSKHYVFFVQFARDDEDYWVSKIGCTGLTAENKLFWGPR